MENARLDMARSEPPAPDRSDAEETSRTPVRTAGLAATAPTAVTVALMMAIWATTVVEPMLTAVMKATSGRSRPTNAPRRPFISAVWASCVSCLFRSSAGRARSSGWVLAWTLPRPVR